MHCEDEVTEQDSSDILEPVKPERKRKPTTSPAGKITSKQKLDNMAATAEQVEGLRKLLQELKTDQQALRQSLESRIENTKQELNTQMNTRFRSLKDELNIEMQGHDKFNTWSTFFSMNFAAFSLFKFKTFSYI